MNKSERNDRGGSKADRGQNDNFGKNPTYKKFPSSSSKAKQQEDVKRESPSKEDILLFDDDDQPSNTKNIQKNQPNERPSNAIDTIFKKLKKGREEYSKLESQSFEPKRDKEKISGLLLEPSKDFLGVPWMSKKTMAISSSLVRAHNEIIEFVNYIVPTKEDHRVREKSLEKLTNKIMVVYPDCIVKPFGSFTTKVYLPNADIDLVVVKTDINSTTLLHVLAQKLMKDDEYEQFQIIRSAKVPLIKLVEKSTGINFDISFNKLDGVKQIKIVEGAFELYPEMRYLIIVLKVMLRQRDLHETYHGGVGSFLLFCLVLTFVREIKKDFITINKRDQIQELLLSDMLLLLFEYYGINFDLNTKGITIANGGAIVDKIERDNSLSVISPQDPTHDIGGPSYRIKDVFNVFKNRYHFLTNYNFKEGESFMQFLVDPGMIEGWKK